MRHCRKCACAVVNADPAIAERRKLAIQAKHREPEHKAKHAVAAARNLQIAREKHGPEWMVEQGRKLHLASRTPEAMAAYHASRSASGRKRTETTIGWCPPEWREHYRHLIKIKHIPAAEARPMIEAEIAAEPKRVIARINAEMLAKEARRKREAY